jgi:SAM-dependent methyltransferase
MTTLLDAPARQTYDAFAAAYDDYNHGYMYERWTGRLLALAEDAGLEGDRLLDVGCGTGLSFIPMLARGWRVTACDISPNMLAIAQSKVDDAAAATLLTADMRELPALGEFNLAWAVNDAMNYLLNPRELESTLRGLAANLALGGFVLFDLNTLATFRSSFCTEFVSEHDGQRFIWRGQMSAANVEPSSINEAHFEVEGEDGSACVHIQRHFTESEVTAALAGAGLELARVVSELDGSLHDRLDEKVHTKAVYLATAG